MRKHAGFTLIEMLVALTISSVVIIAAHQVFTGVADGARAVNLARERLDRNANARRWLKATFLSLQPPFDGRTSRVSFTSWQMTEGGWFAPKSVVLTLEKNRLVTSGADPAVALRDGVSSVAFDYLLEPGADTKWVREWVSPVSAPLAIRLRIVGCGKRDAGCVDTLLFLVRERG